MSTGAAVAVHRAERRLIERLRQDGGASAIPLPDLRGIEERVLRRLIAAGAVREVQPGHYQLDEAGYAAYRAGRLRLVAAIVGAVLVVALLVAWWANRG